MPVSPILVPGCLSQLTKGTPHSQWLKEGRKKPQLGSQMDWFGVWGEAKKGQRLCHSPTQGDCGRQWQSSQWAELWAGPLVIYLASKGKWPTIRIYIHRWAMVGGLADWRP